MLQFVIAIILGVAGLTIFLFAPVTIFLGQKRGNWEMGHKRMLRYLSLSQLGVTLALTAWIISDFRVWQTAILFFTLLATFHILIFTIHWLQMRWLVRIAKKLRDEPRWR